MKKYSIGVDYGTQSGRAVLVDVSNGEVVAQAVKEYSHGVIDEFLPRWNKIKTRLGFTTSKRLYRSFRINNPEVLKKSNIDPKDVIGLAIDFTACTVLSIDKEGVPLCFHEDLKSNPHAWPKLWKHHAAQYEANKLNTDC